jgi:hypothetical protein
VRNAWLSAKALTRVNKGSQGTAASGWAGESGAADIRGSFVFQGKDFDFQVEILRRNVIYSGVCCSSIKHERTRPPFARISGIGAVTAMQFPVAYVQGLYGAPPEIKSVNQSSMVR